MSTLRKVSLPATKSPLHAALAILFLAGCTAVGPDFETPQIPLPEVWHTGLKGGLAGEGADLDALATWWKTLGDPDLSSLIERSVSRNLDLRTAEARVREALARRGVARSDLLPAVDGTASSTRSWSDIGTGDAKTRRTNAAGIDASWELDLFGRVRRSAEAAEADVQASLEDLHDVMVSLVAEVALEYIQVRTLQTRLTVAEANLEAQNQTYQLASWRYQAGLSDELAVHQAQYNLVNTRSQIPTLRSAMEEAVNRIAVLLGEPPGRLYDELEKRKAIPVPPLKVAVGVPAEALRRRPDVRRAERQLAAQTARVGVATADLYPRITLSGSIGLEALSLRDPASSWIWSAVGILPQITWPIFKAGAIRHTIDAQSAIQDQYRIGYEAALLGALEEVENALSAYGEEQIRRQDLSEGTQAAQKAAELAQHKFEAGLADFNSVLDAQRTLLSLQDQLVQSESAITSDLVRLYKALGGGWSSLAPDDTTSSEHGETR